MYCWYTPLARCRSRLPVFGACRLVGCRPSNRRGACPEVEHTRKPPSLGIVRMYFYVHYSKIPGGFRVFFSAILPYWPIDQYSSESKSGDMNCPRSSSPQ